MKTSRKTLATALLAALAVTPALADKDGQGHGKRRDDDRDRVVQVERHHHHRDDRVVLVDPGPPRGCPPGLAKKNPPCVPPGQAKKGVAVVGQALPPGAVFVVPQPVLATLPPPPPGYRYAVVNNQVVLVSGANIVVEIVLRNLFG